MLGLIHHLYSFLYTLGLLLYLPFYLIKVLFGQKESIPILIRGGFLPKKLAEITSKRGCRVWIHAVSVGEVNSIRTLVESLALPSDCLYISTTTQTGQTVAQEHFGGKATVFFFPLDWSFSCLRYLRSINPDLVILTETELWPSFIRCVKKREIPLLLINGRFSDQSFKRYRQFSFLTRSMLTSFCKLGMQSRQDRERAINLGSISDRTHTVGNLKFDYSLPDNSQATQASRDLGLLLGKEKGSLIWVCGSTHEGEEETLLNVFLALRKEFDQLRLVLAPRHPHRAKLVTKLLDKASLTVVRRSQMDSVSATSPHIAVIDTIGELPHLYEIADVVFIGGTLIPVGGHNLIEAAHFKKPIIFGPHMGNFREMKEVFLRSYGALQIHSSLELKTKMKDLLRDTSTREWLGRNARTVVRENKGAMRRTLELIRLCAPEIINSQNE